MLELIWHRVEHVYALSCNNVFFLPNKWVKISVFYNVKTKRGWWNLCVLVPVDCDWTEVDASSNVSEERIMMQVCDCVETRVRKERQSWNVCLHARTMYVQLCKWEGLKMANKPGRGVSFLCKIRLTHFAAGRQRSTSQHCRIQTTTTRYNKRNTTFSSLKWSREKENAKRVRTWESCAGVDKRARWLERENEVGENQKACICGRKNERTGVEGGEEANTCDNQTLPPVK